MPTIPGLLASISPIYLSVGFLLYLVLPNLPPPWDRFHVYPNQAMACFAADIAFAMAGLLFANALETALKEGFTRPAPLVGGFLWVCFIGFFYAKVLGDRIGGWHAWIPFVLFFLSFVSTAYTAVSADYPQKYFAYMTDRAMLSVFLVMMLAWFPFAMWMAIFSQKFDLGKFGICYFFIYLPISMAIDGAVRKSYSLWEGRSWELTPMTVVADIDRSGTHPKLVFRTLDGKPIEDSAVDNTRELDHQAWRDDAQTVFPKNVVLLYDPQVPGKYTLPPPKKPEFKLRKLF
jgi:hypothetical protein